MPVKDSMDLSVIIVNYNVKYFLEQALLSAEKSIKASSLNVETFVVDNASSDNSVELVKEKFPWVHLIANEENLGFSKANNIAIKKAKGRYVLLLNPDTVIEENTFDAVVKFMDTHPDAGGLGVKMIDGSGKFLPESKRGLPSPSVAFYKLTGLSRLFPKSKTFGKYHLSYLDENEIHSVDILSGAFMLLKKEAIDKVGLLDEDFFMYGEDIDLSYRIIKAGYKNYYYPHTRIIHYKGESTKKGSLNYVRMFYKAMKIFANKHFTSGEASLYSLSINIAVFFRAAIDVVFGFFKNSAFPFLDAGLIFGIMFLLKNFWEKNILAGEGIAYPDTYMLFNVPLYILVWLSSTYLNGGYDKPIKVQRIIRGLLLGTLFIAAIYGFLPESYRFSRSMILLGAVLAILSMVSIRYLLHLLVPKLVSLHENKSKRIIIAGERKESERVLSLLNQIGIQYNYVGLVSDADEESEVLGPLDKLDELVRLYTVDEIIFCSKDVSSRDIIQWMTRIGSDLSYRILPQESLSIVGSNSKNTAGDLYAIDISLKLASTIQKRNKRLLDILVCIITAILLPILVFFIGKPIQFVSNWWKVFIGRFTWVGYAHNPAHQSWLPNLRQGVLSPLDNFDHKEVKNSTIQRINLLYAKEYTPLSDIEIIRKSLKMLGKKVHVL